MSPRDRFLQAAVEPLADNAELQLAARHQLEASLSPEAGEAELDAAASRLERGGKVRWRRAWAVAVLLCSLPMLLGPVRSLVAGYREFREVSSGPFRVASTPLSEAWELSPQERLLLFGEPVSGSSAETWRPLWESDPENPMFYLEYARGHEEDFSDVPPDFLQQGEALDPDNGWFLLKLATLDHRSVVERDRSSSRLHRSGPKKPVTWTVKDAGELAKRIDLLHRAAAAGRIDSYQGELNRLRFESLPQAGELVEQLRVMAYLAGGRLDRVGMGVADLIGAEARRCEAEGDRQGFVALAETWEAVMKAQVEDGFTLVDMLLARAALTATLPVMSEVAAALDVDPVKWKGRAKRAEESLSDRMEKEKHPSSRRVALQDRISRHASVLGALSLPVFGRQCRESPELTRAELLPATRTEQAFLGRAMSGVGWQILGLVSLLSLAAGASQSMLIKRMEPVLSRLLGPRDAAWIALGGVVLPLAIFLFLRHATPLSRLDWGPRLTFYAVPIAHFVGLLLMLLVWPVAIASWRVAKAGSPLGWKRPGWLAVSVAVAPPAGMLCFSFAVPPGPASMPLAIAGMALGAWALVGLGLQSSVFSKAEARLRRRVISRAVRPAWWGGLLVMVALAFHFHAEERRWFARDELMRVTRPGGLNDYEIRVTEQLREEMGELLE